VARALLGEAAVLEADLEMGAEDFSFYLRQVPGCYFLLGMRPPSVDRCPPNHSPQFDFADAAIATGVRLFVALALSGQ
jgi:metal-dependent amidase/aminoacylase/carboxypeptidase family protein